MRTRKTAEIRKAEIVDAALHLADELGPDRLTTEAVAKAVGLTQPGIFRHFPKKQDLWEAVGARVAETIKACWNKAQMNGASPTDRLRALVVAQLRLIRSNPAIPSILFSRELHVENETLRLTLFDCMTQFRGRLAQLLTEARMAGEVRSDLDPEDAASLALGLIQGLTVRWSLSGRAFDLADEGARLLEILLRVIASAPGMSLAPNGFGRPE